MKLFGNDSRRGAGAERRSVSRDTEDFAPVSAAKAEKAREGARKSAEKAREGAYKEYGAGGGQRMTYAEAKSAAKAHKRGSAAPQKGAEPPAREKEPGRMGAGKKAAIIICSVLAALLAGTAGFALYVSRSGVIYPNVSLSGVGLGGLTVTEAAYELETSGWTNEDESVTVLLPMEHSLTVTASEAGASVTAEQAARTAYDYCHEGNMFSCLARYIGCLVSGGSVNVEIDVDEAAVEKLVGEAARSLLEDYDASAMSFDEEEAVLRVVKGTRSGMTVDTGLVTQMVCEALAARDYGEISYEPAAGSGEFNVEDLHEAVYREAVSAGWDSEKEEVTESVTGVDFDTAEARRLWDAAATGDIVEIPCEITEPEYTTEQYSELLFADQLGDPVTTSLSGSTANRITNVDLAAKAIDGIILSPGEQFDYNSALGQRTEARGYKAAGAYSGGQVVQEVGGGICQVSSALYYAALLANLQIDVRSCHYFPVGYLPAGLDATVSWGGPEFRFTNNRDFPVKITASVDRGSNTVTVNILGTNLDGGYVVMEHAVTGYVYGNSEYPTVATGYRAQTHRCVYDAGGNLISRTLEANSEYHYHEENIVYPSPSPSPPPEEDGENYYFAA